MLKTLLNVAYPPVCEACGEAYFVGDVPNLCGKCEQQLLFPMRSPFCEVCGQSYQGMPFGMQCSNCSGRYLEFDFSTSAYHAEGEIMDWMHRFKYVNEVHFARMFGKLMARIWEEDQRIATASDWVVVPVPLHRKRMRERGFNQSLEIAREWVKHAPEGINLRIAEALKRHHYTTRQAILDRRDRLTNLRGAFGPSKRVIRNLGEVENLIIVDDVLTTGTTASECAAVLRELLSPNRIIVITVVRG